MSSVQEDLDLAYRPSRWSKRLPADQVVENHIQSSRALSLRAREVVQKQTILHYGNQESEKVLLFGTNLPSNSPLMVYFSGGYWQALSGSISAYPVLPLYEHGIVAAIVDYQRVPAAASVSEVTAAAVAATRCVLDYALRSGSSSILLMGHSAGAHLVSMVVTSKWFSELEDCQRKCFKAVFLLSGVFDLKPLINTSINDALAMTNEEAETNSPIQEDNLKSFVANVARNEGLEVVVVVAENEAPGLTQQSKDFHKALEASGVKNLELMIVAQVDHFDLVEKLASDRYSVTQEVIKRLKANASTFP